MATITVRMGREEKEISGLTRRTTCSDVLQALLKDKKIDNNNEAGTNNDDLASCDSKSLKEIAQSYVIVETWRGCEKPLPPRTRILAVWQAWGKEQCHVKFSLKKSRHIRFRESENKEQVNNQYNSMIAKMSMQHPEAISFLHKLSHGQKRRIRRNIMQYQRAVLIQHTKETTVDNGAPADAPLRHFNLDDNAIDSAANKCGKPRGKQLDNERVTLSEEKFVDGVVTGPDCLLHHSGKSKFIQSALDNKDFNREYCNYRRRNHHRRRSFMLDDSDGHSDQNDLLSPTHHRHNISHYPYCQKSRRRSRSSSKRRRRSKTRRQGGVSKSSRGRHGRLHNRVSTDDTTTSTGTATSTEAEVECEDSHSPGEDADDEKSIKAEYGSTPVRKVLPYPTVLLSPCSDSYSSGTATATTATDSSSGTTTCSETSNTSGSSLSGTSSSEMSSSTEHWEAAFFASRLAAPKPAPVPAKPAVPEKTRTPGNNSSAAKLFRKVPQGLIGSFRKKKRSTPQPTENSSTKANNAKTTGKRTVTFAASPPTHKDRNSTTKERSDKGVTTTYDSSASKADTGVSTVEKEPQTQDNPATESKHESGLEESKSIEKWKQIILSQDKLLKEKQEKVASTHVDIQKIESEVHRWRTQTHGKNYVQDTYLSGMEAPSAASKSRFGSNSLRPPQWLAECQDAVALSEYVDSCQKVVEMQLKIEEHKRQFEIVLQDMQDEVWKASNDPSAKSQAVNPITAAASALGLVPSKDDGDSSDDESNTRHESLMVSSGKQQKSTTDNTNDREKIAAAEATLEVERSNTEMEANLYLSLRLSSELQEVEQKMDSSQRLLQAKGETLLAMVRNLAESPDGISPELWEEYGDLLTAYDAEVSLQRYLAACADNKDETSASQSEDAAADGTDEPLSSPTTSALHHALSPWLWCEHCKIELEQQQRGHAFDGQTPPVSPHWISHSGMPLNLSELPLPSPTAVTSPPRAIAPLLPMPPINVCNDSDYEDLSNDNKGDAATSTIISTENAIPRGMVLRHSGRHQKDKQQIAAQLNYLAVNRNNSANHTDDSGNASATSSLASSNSDGGSIDMGSRNSSCDGGSPCPGAESQDSGSSSPFFIHGKRSGWMSKFPFPPKHNEDGRGNSRSPLRYTQHRSSSNGPMKPVVPPKPNATHSNEQKRLPRPSKDDMDRLQQQQKLIRRNSGGRRRNPAPTNDDKQAFGRRASSFGKAGVGVLPNRLNGLVSHPIVNNSHCDLRQRDSSQNRGGQNKVRAASTKPNSQIVNKAKHPMRHAPSPIDIISNVGGVASAPCSPHGYQHQKLHPRDPRRILNSGDVKRRIHSDTYDNDSDTGLSSLHSADSDLVMYSETLV
uniref:Uncharacterized protein LOC100177998 n=1 Tax=Phallusia mammillata TaxID=59560 RepID=A0A6F9DHN3_9ASCI|nr:uncharacterized protein LOC100177998 [Phallusia mammillata]